MARVLVVIFILFVGVCASQCLIADCQQCVRTSGCVFCVSSLQSGCLQINSSIVSTCTSLGVVLSAATASKCPAVDPCQTLSGDCRACLSRTRPSCRLCRAAMFGGDFCTTLLNTTDMVCQLVAGELVTACPTTTTTKVITPAPTVRPVDCVLSPYVPTERCSVPACGGGNRTVRATVLTPAQGSGRACPALEQVESCNDQPCPALLETGLRWRLVSSDELDTFSWPSFRKELAYDLVLDERRLLLRSVMAGSTVVELTLLDAAGDDARNHAAQLAALAGNATSGLNVVSSSESLAASTTAALTASPASAPIDSQPDVALIVGATVGAVAVLLASGFALFLALRARKSSRSPPSAPTAVYQTMPIARYETVPTMTTAAGYGVGKVET